MISFNSTLIALLQNPVINAFYLVKIGLPSGFYLTTSHFANITLSNGDTYLSDGKLLSADVPKLSSVVDREIYKVVLADVDYTLGAAMQTGIVGKVFEVRIGFIDPATEVPYTQIENTILAYKGIIDSIGYSIETGNTGEAALSISGASPMADLDLTRTPYSSKEYIRGLFPNDSCFDQVYEGSGPVNIKWGKG
jgi:hypothetical protein